MAFPSEGFESTQTISPAQQMAMSRFVTRTYGWMFLGLLLTAFISYAIASSETAVTWLMQNRWAFYGAIIAEFAVVIALTAAARRLSAFAATLGFVFYAALNGVVFSAIFLVYTMSSIANVFFIAAAMFGGLALFGAVTKKDLTALGTFVGMGLWGLILLGLVNMFVGSQSLNFGLGLAGVLIFAGLTAYDSQKIRMMAYQSAGDGARGGEAEKGAIFGALMMYLNFINLFLSLLRVMGSRRG
ncbi:MAG: Bax inhibitor-1/YccA family protein [Deltaproteobacteria bacterium]|nr:Bax inhibitor-1/YccA family protein [Deltaproteobacteria bacterium]